MGQDLMNITLEFFEKCNPFSMCNKEEVLQNDNIEAEITNLVEEILNQPTNFSIGPEQVAIADESGLELINRTTIKVKKLKKLHMRNLQFSFGNGNRKGCTKEEIKDVLIKELDIISRERQRHEENQLQKSKL